VVGRPDDARYALTLYTEFGRRYLHAPPTGFGRLNGSTNNHLFGFAMCLPNLVPSFTRANLSHRKACSILVFSLCLSTIVQLRNLEICAISRPFYRSDKNSCLCSTNALPLCDGTGISLDITCRLGRIAFQRQYRALFFLSNWNWVPKLFHCNVVSRAL